MKKLTTKTILARKSNKNLLPLKMLTCYDFQTAQLLNESELDLILVGDSLGNVILGYDTTVEVTLNDMLTFGSAVKRGAPNKFVVIDMPFGTYATINEGIKNGISLFQKTKAEALKLEGAHSTVLEVIRELTAHGVPVIGHIGLTPQSVHQMGGYYTHGKSDASASALIHQAEELQKVGVCALVLECVTEELSTQITKLVKVPTIGIGSGSQTDGQVLVINDLLHLGKNDPPQFCTPLQNLYQLKKELVAKQIKNWNGFKKIESEKGKKENADPFHH